jgi:hypothetical protein
MHDSIFPKGLPSHRDEDFILMVGIVHSHSYQSPCLIERGGVRGPIACTSVRTPLNCAARDGSDFEFAGVPRAGVSGGGGKSLIRLQSNNDKLTAVGASHSVLQPLASQGSENRGHQFDCSVRGISAQQKVSKIAQTSITVF